MTTSRSNSKKSIKGAYDAGLAEVQRVLFSTKSTPAQRKAAKQSLNDLTAMLLAHTLDTVQGRTALLAGLIVELNQVISKVETRPPFSNAVAKLTGAIKTAQTLLDSEKKDLI